LAGPASAILVVLTAALAASAQEGGGPEPPPFRSLRYEEDYGYLRDPARRADPLDPLKWIRLGPSPEVWLSLGGEARWRYENYRNPDLGLGQPPPPGRDDYLLQRLLLHGDLRLGPNLRVFAQVGDFRVFGRRGAVSATDENPFDVVQGFAELALPPGLAAGDRFTLRAGRHEFSFGSQRLVSVREGPNVRRAFDAARAIWQGGGYRLDAFASRPVELRRDHALDDRSNPSQAFWGAYGTGPVPGLGEALRADLYYLGLEREDAAFAQGAGTERRHTLGARLFGAAGAWDWDVEAAWQFGSLRPAAGRIRAWTVASDLGFTLGGLPWSPRLGVKTDIASGDGDPRDRTLGTFNPLFPKLPYFSEASLVFPANVVDLNPNVTLAPTEGVSLLLGWNLLWRHRRADAFYAPPLLEPVAGTAGRGGRAIGQQLYAVAEWQATRNLEVRAFYVRFLAGGAVSQAGGRDSDFLGGSVAFRF
jgi:hypothetical protein